MQETPYADRPAVVVWEMTRACRLACRHCRATAQREPDPNQLSVLEGYNLLEQIAAAAPDLLILTGGDPARRADLLRLIRRGTSLGLRIALSPSATPDLLALDFNALREAGVRRVSLSLDGATPETHNAFRGVSRAWDWTMRAAAQFRVAGIPFQINTTITKSNLGEFDDLARVVTEMQPAAWTIFLVVPMGRAKNEPLPSPFEVEQLFLKLRELSLSVPFAIRTTEGQHYRRILAQHPRSKYATPLPAPINDAKGFVFVSHTGEVCPSGFLPIGAGNVRNSTLLEVYRAAPLFRALRDPARLQGKCGRCKFNALCGGSRARAYAVTGDPLAEEPLCSYQPSK